MIRVLFICSGNACLSQMAEGFALMRKDSEVEVQSACVEAAPVHAIAAKVMGEVGVDISGLATRSLDSLANSAFDVVITLCGEAAQSCPLLPGNPPMIHWHLANPAGVTGDEDIVLKTFRDSRDHIRRLVDDFFDRGYCSAFLNLQHCGNMILDNVSDGIIAHDIDRRIFYLNSAAEDITGYSADEIIGRQCQDVFPGNFCGAKCLFCGEEEPRFDVVRRDVELRAKDGAQKSVAMSVKSISDPMGVRGGVIVSFRDMTHERYLARRVKTMAQFAGIVGRDEKMLEIFDLIRDLSDTVAPVLIRGESGTGKELVAAAIHSEGSRANGLFVPVNCGALPEGLLESELFGHVRGAFTGAIRDKKGRFELADGGTIFLDEIGDISPAMQVKLLRVLQDGRFERVGGEKTLKVNVRVISATNKDFEREIDEGRFREDLYYRLNVVPVFLPPLRERRTDIPALVNHTLAAALRDAGRDGVRVDPETMDVMMSYDWPGNVRELQNWIQFALVKCRNSVILPQHLPPTRSGIPRPAKRRRRKLHLEMVREALAETGGNKLEAAKALGVSRATLYRFLEEVSPQG